eukprot:COSAG05_NODE_1062_length_5993_cov_8.045640_11_plen_147_part_00
MICLRFYSHSGLWRHAGHGEWTNVTFELAGDTLTIIAVKGRRASLRRCCVLGAAHRLSIHIRIDEFCMGTGIGCKIGLPKSAREGHPHTFRLDLAEPDSGAFDKQLFARAFRADPNCLKTPHSCDPPTKYTARIAWNIIIGFFCFS